MNRELNDAIDRIFGGYSILFVGSGFSSYATNQHNLGLPTGSKLVQLLKDQTGIKADYPLDILAREYVTQQGEHKLLAQLNDRLAAKNVSAYQTEVISLPWRRIYTTNYDNVVELCAAELPKKVVPVTLREKADHDRSITQCVHLNGRLAQVSISNFLHEIKLTRASYLTDTFINTGWLTTFRNDLSLATSVFFVGYSMYDIDVARIVYEDPMLKEKTFFVDASDLDPIIGRELGQFGSVFTVGLEGFAKACSTHVAPAQPKRHFTAVERFELPKSTEAATGDDVLSLLIRGEIKDRLIPASFAGKEKYLINRAAVSEMHERIKNGGKRFLIHGDLGNGKTALLHLLRVKLVQEGLSVLELKQSFDSAEEDTLLMKQAHTEPNAYYPYKVARSYKDFVAQNFNRLTAEQRGVIGGAINQMIAQIDKSSRHVMRYRLVQECREDLVGVKEMLLSPRS